MHIASGKSVTVATQYIEWPSCIASCHAARQFTSYRQNGAGLLQGGRGIQPYNTGLKPDSPLQGLKRTECHDRGSDLLHVLQGSLDCGALGGHGVGLAPGAAQASRGGLRGVLRRGAIRPALTLVRPAQPQHNSCCSLLGRP